jgi:cell division protein FtsQ
MLSKIKFLKIKFRNSILVIFWFVAICMLMAYVDRRQSEKICQKVLIEVDNEFENYFIDDKDVNSLMTVQEKENLINNMNQFVDLRTLEKRVKKHGFVEKISVFRDLKGNIKAKVNQYKPILRLALGNGQGRYVSSNGKILPLSERYTARVLVFNGNYNALLAKEDWDRDSLRLPYFQFVKAVEEDPFLQAMVASVGVNNGGELTIYPQIGKQIIEFGIPENLDVKFAMLKAFYTQIIPAKGWNNYVNVSLKFENQIVCE